MKRALLAVAALSAPFLACAGGERPTVTNITAARTTEAKEDPQGTCYLLDEVRRGLGKVGTSVVIFEDGEMTTSFAPGAMKQYQFSLNHSVTDAGAGGMLPDNEKTRAVTKVGNDLNTAARDIEEVGFDRTQPSSVENALRQMVVIKGLDKARADVDIAIKIVDCQG